MSRKLTPTTIALLGIGALVTILAVGSMRIARRHAQAAERVLADYASLGAEGVSGRLQSVVASRFVQLLNALPIRSRTDGAINALAPAVAVLAKGMSWAGEIDSSAFRIVSYDSSAVVPRGILDSIRTTTERLPEGAYLGMFRHEHAFVVFAARGQNVWRVFALPLDSLAPSLKRFITNEPVLPRALTRGENVGDGIGVRVLLDDVVLAERGIDRSRFVARSSPGPMFGGLAVEVLIAESLAPTLIIGGLPGSPTPFVIVVVMMTVSLLGLIIAQLRQRERLNQLREDFVAGTSHELRTPLAQIRLFAETLRLERVRSDSEREHAFGVIEREARRLEHLVDNMLHVSRVDRGVLALSKSPVDIGAATQEIVADFQPVAAKAGVAVRMVPAARAMSEVDPGAWRQIVLNLLDNAVRYAGRSADVKVSVDVEQKQVRLEVEDNGPGVPAADRARVWERFWRGEAGRNAGIVGAGIGLATVHDLVLAHGGSCKVTEATPHGARFEVFIPELTQQP